MNLYPEMGDEEPSFGGMSNLTASKITEQDANALLKVRYAEAVKDINVEMKEDISSCIFAGINATDKVTISGYKERWVKQELAPGFDELMKKFI